MGTGLGQSLLSAAPAGASPGDARFNHTYFRDVPTYDSVLVGTGLLDKYLYQGFNGGARVQLPLHLVGYASLGESNSSGDKKNALNQLFGLTATRLGKTGLGIDARYSKFDSAFASGTYRTVSITKDMGQRFRFDRHGRALRLYLVAGETSKSLFINALFDADLGARMFVQSAFTTQRGGTSDYNQLTNPLGTGSIIEPQCEERRGQTRQAMTRSVRSHVHA